MSTAPRLNPNLPTATSFSEVAELLGAFHEVGFSNWSLLVRTVSFKENDTWYNYATSASLVDGERRINKLISIRDQVALLEWGAPISQPLTVPELTAHLSHWRSTLQVSFGIAFQKHVNLARVPSDFQTRAWPHWSAQLHEHGGQHRSNPMPDGPFFDAKERFFGKDVPRLAMQFLGESRFAQQLSAPNEYVLKIPDRRARIARLDFESNLLIVRVDNPLGCSLYCSVATSSYAGQVFHDVVPVNGDRALVELPFTPENVEIWVILPDGYMLDHYEETPHRSTWGSEGLLVNARHNAQPHAIGTALAGGENESVEFKAYVKAKPRDGKTGEILRTVSAFANMKGGDLYIGVNDSAEVVGIDADLNRDYGEKHRNIEARRDAYEKDLRKLINEGTSPTLPIEFHWHDVAHRAVLLVRIPMSQILVHLLESGEVYRRAGATNRKWRPVDALTSADGKREYMNPLGTK